jgi:hypothetical protein
MPINIPGRGSVAFVGSSLPFIKVLDFGIAKQHGPGDLAQDALTC